MKSIRPPNTKELFVYKLLHHIDIGPISNEPFIIPSHNIHIDIGPISIGSHLTKRNKPVSFVLIFKFD